MSDTNPIKSLSKNWKTHHIPHNVFLFNFFSQGLTALHDRKNDIYKIKCLKAGSENLLSCCFYRIHLITPWWLSQKRNVPKWFSYSRLLTHHSEEWMHPAFLWPPGSPFQHLLLSSPLSVFPPHSDPLPEFVHCLQFPPPTIFPTLPTSPLFPFLQNLPQNPMIPTRHNMCLTCRYFFTACPVSKCMLISSCSETIWAGISSSSAYTGPLFESLTSIQSQSLNKL